MGNEYQSQRSGIDRRDGHCSSHEERCDLHEKLAAESKEVRDEVMAVRTERKTEKWFYGIIGSIILVILGLFQWVFNDNLSMIRNDLTSIKAFVGTGSIAVATNRMEIDALKERLTAIEAEIIRGHK